MVGIEIFLNSSAIFSTESLLVGVEIISEIFENLICLRRKQGMVNENIRDLKFISKIISGET